ncbi:MAG: hypothetical protein WC796_02600 [Candidatus Pacearchaeota archaeon]|jgi:hypothetical protein
MVKQIKNFLIYIIVALVFFAVMEFMFSVLIRGDLSNFFGSIVFNLVFVIFVFFSSKLIDLAFRKSWVADVVVYFVYGFVGLMIEWFIIGNSPWQNPLASQVTMFSYWAGAIIMARIFTDDSKKLKSLKRGTLLFFVPYAFISIAAGFLIVNYEWRFAVLIWLAIIGYDLMNIFYLWYFVKKYREKKS